MTHRLSSKIKQHSRLIRSAGPGPLVADLRRWTWSDDLAVGMSRDLAVTHTPPPAKVPIEIVRLDDAIAMRLFDDSGLDPGSKGEMESRRRMWEDGIPGAYVALDHEGNPCYVQWAIPGSEASLVRDYFRGGFPDLGPHELLLEAAWATPAARGKRIMSEAMSRITEAAADDHARAITFVGVVNEPSIRGCRGAGFEIYIQRREKWRIGRRTIGWEAAA